jgi:hypothetical protein
MPAEELQESYSIYIVFISTKTYMGKMIRLFTHNEYSHVTIAFDRDLRKMYSFARYYINSPILGGFVTERPLRYLYGNNDVNIKLCEIPLGKEEYYRIEKKMNYFYRNSDIMIYNTINAVLSLMGKKLNTKNMFTCLEFVTYLLRYTNIMTIRELERRLKDYIIYQGSLRAITYLEQEDVNRDEFFRKRRMLGVVGDTIYHFRKVVTRVLQA